MSVVRGPYGEALFWRYKWVSKYCKGLDVLDIPCGMGWGTSLLKRARSVVGVDIDSDAVAEARRRYGRRATFLVGDMRNLEFKSNSFDVVSCLEGIEHVPADVAKLFVMEAVRVLRPTGLLFLSSPYCLTKEHSGNPYHLKEYKKKEITELITPKFRIIEEIDRKVDNLMVCYFQTRKLL